MAAILVCGIIFYKQVTKVDYVQAKIGSEIFKLEVAKTQAAREQGLSERDGISINEGMLFDFGQNGRWRMWMVQMRFPIDIAWLDESKKIIYIKSNATPAEFPETYDAKQDSRYVIEVNSGTLNRLNVNIGDSISF
jgi:uncharacterized membrane protein (UPF0127 family)